MMKPSHSVIRNNSNICTTRNEVQEKNCSPARARRRKPAMENHSTNHHRGALRDLKDVENVQLEQAVRELRCFEGLEHSTLQRTHRTFAVEYIESLLERWSCEVENSQSEKPLVEVPVFPTSRSFAAVVSGEAEPRTEAIGNCESNRPGNAWQRPLSLAVSMKDDPYMDTVSSTFTALIPFGSYRLGVHSSNSDLDLLALTPPYISRHDFFTSLVTILQEDDRCSDVHPIPTAYTPVIKFMLKCDGPDSHCEIVPIDLLYSRVTDTTKLVEYHKAKVARKKLTNQPHLIYYLDDTDLQDLDEIGVRSLNGARVSQMLLEFNRKDVGKFQTVLCVVKHWALVHGVYSNVLGFLGGVNWAIMVTWVCRRFPDAGAAKTLKLFFRTFSKWQWNHPILLNDRIADTPPICNVSRQTRAVQLPAWNPAVNPRDGMHLMPIITPAYPSMNSSYNVDYPQLRRIQHEMSRTSSLLLQMSKNSHHGIGPYRSLFKPSDFFRQHKYFLQVDINASSKEYFVKWFRFVESKLRNLISSLETTEVHAWPFARFFDVPRPPSADTNRNAVTSSTLEEKSFFIGLSLDSESVDIGHLTMDFLYKVNLWEGRKATMNVTIAHITRDDVPLFVLEAMAMPVAHSFPQDGSTDSENTAPATDDEDDDETL
jgi:poly(A) polymerase